VHKKGGRGERGDNGNGFFNPHLLKPHVGQGGGKKKKTQKVPQKKKKKEKLGKKVSGSKLFVSRRWFFKPSKGERNLATLKVRTGSAPPPTVTWFQKGQGLPPA